MERQWSLVAVLLLAVQARANPWVFGEDHANYRNIYQKYGHILPFTYSTRQIITIPPCMSLKHVWVKVSNTLGFTPSVKFHKTINVVSIVYGLLQHTGSDYSIVVRGVRTPNCNPGIHENDGFIPYRLKGTKAQKLKKNRDLRKGPQDLKEALDEVDRKNSGNDDDLKYKKYRYNNALEDKYDSIKETYEDMSNELKEVGSREKQNYMVFIVTGIKASQKATGDNGGDIGYDRGSVKGYDGVDYGLDYGFPSKIDYSHKGSKYTGVDEYSGDKGHTNSGGYDRGKGNGKGVSYRGTDGNRHSKREAYNHGSSFNSDDKNSMLNGYGGSNRHVKGKTSLGMGYRGSNNDENDPVESYDDGSGSKRHTKNKNSIGYVKGKGYGGSRNDENDQGDSYDEDSDSYRHTKNKNSVVSKGSNNEENYKRGLYDGDIRYFVINGPANNKGYDGSSRLDDDYLDGFGIGNRNLPNGIGKDITMFCSDYLRNNNGRETKNIAVDKKVIDYCLSQVGGSNI